MAKFKSRRLKFLDMFDDLLARARALDSAGFAVKGRVYATALFTGEVLGRHPGYVAVDGVAFEAWKQKCVILLSQVIPDGNPAFALVHDLQMRYERPSSRSLLRTLAARLAAVREGLAGGLFDDYPTPVSAGKGETMSGRQVVPATMKKKLFQEAGSRCCICREDDVHKLVIHHIMPWAENKTHDPSQMIVLCANCHADATAGMLTRERLYESKREMQKIIPLHPKPGSAPAVTVQGDNNTVAGRDVNVTINAPAKRGKRTVVNVPVAGTVSEDPLMRGYLKYLFDRYLAFKKWDCDINGEELKASLIYRAFKTEMRFDWKLTPNDLPPISGPGIMLVRPAF